MVDALNVGCVQNALYFELQSAAQHCDFRRFLMQTKNLETNKHFLLLLIRLTLMLMSLPFWLADPRRLSENILIVLLVRFSRQFFSIAFTQIARTELDE